MADLSLRFPAHFLWGASTAAHQVEGGNINSDWWEREHRADTPLSEPSGDAADSYHRYAEDMSLLKEMGLNSYRFSIEWARIEPEEGFFSRAQLAHYRSMIDSCWNAGLTPMVTLHHFTNPRWFAHQGGWKSPGAVDCFGRYVERVCSILDGVELVCTINEPNMVAIPHPESVEDLTGAPIPEPDPVVSEVIVAAHNRARDILGERTRAKTGWSVATQAYHPVPGCEEATARYGYPREDYFLQAACHDDWLGIQAYLRTFISDVGPSPVPEGAEKTLTGWEYFPPAAAFGIRNARRLCGDIPLYVTENGLATDNDARRIDYIHDALTFIHQEMENGADIRGYFCWSALDNYEWGSYRPTFGLMSWDPQTFARSVKPSGWWLGNVARSGALFHPDTSHEIYQPPALSFASDHGGSSGVRIAVVK